MKYKANKKITKKVDCDMLYVLSNHLITAKGKTISLMNFAGIIEREWVLDSEVTFIRIMGGAPKKEGFVVSLKSGAILKIFVDNAFPVQLVKQNTPIRMIDISAGRDRLSVVDEYDNLFVFNLKT